MAENFYSSREGQGDNTEADKLLAVDKRIDNEQLAEIIKQQEDASQSFANSNLSRQRAEALNYYLGKPFGNEVEGRSQVVSTDVFEAVEGMLPSLLEIFLASNKLAECEPTGPEDEAEARQQTDVANYIIFKQNNASLIFHTWFKDALLQKTGVVKTYYETENEYRIEQWDQLTEDEFTRIVSDDRVQPIEYWDAVINVVTPDGQQQQVNGKGLKAKVYNKREKICIKNIPPENFLVSVRQSSLDLSECEFACHKEKKTKTDLLEMGVEPVFLEQIGDEDAGEEFTEERIARDIYNVVANRDPAREDESMREYWVSDGVILVDTDGDGIAELRHFIKIGNKVWLNEETDYVPFSVVCPIPLPHQFYGLSIADVIADIQLQKSVLWRQMLDNLYLTNNPRTAVVNGQVNLDDLLTSRPGGLVRMNAPGMATPMETPFVARDSFGMVEYMDGVRENRTGVTRYNQGTDADSLNKTAHGINAILGQSMKRMELIAKLAAETGVKDLVRKVLHCVARSGMKSVVMKLTNGYVSVDPREWKNQFNVTINVGLGTGTKDRQLQMLAMVNQKMLEFKQTGRGYLVSEQNDYNHAVKLAEAAGFKSPEIFFTDPQMVPPQAKQMPPPVEILKLQQDKELKVLDMKVTSEQKDKDMANDRWMKALEVKTDQETKLAIAQIGKQAQENVAAIGSQTQEKVANISADTTKRTKIADAVLRDHEMKNEATMEMFKANPEQYVNDSAFRQVMEAIVASNQQTAEALQAIAQSQERIVQAITAPRKKIKDKSGKTVAVEIEGFAKVPVQ